MNSNIINVGDKVDIRILQQASKEEKEGVVASVYKSSVQDIKPDGLLEISMPMRAGKMVLLSAGIRYECLFHTRNGMYRCLAQVKERYKVDGLYMLLMEPKSALEKRQRREYFRFECAMDMEFCNITAEEADLDDIEEIKKCYRERVAIDFMHQAIAVDLSGGGIRFVSEQKGNKDEFVLVSICLRRIEENQLLEIAGRILSCRRLEGKTGSNKYEYRVQFLTRDQKKREMIIKYIFEQERKNRQKG